MDDDKIRIPKHLKSALLYRFSVSKAVRRKDEYYIAQVCMLCAVYKSNTTEGDGSCYLCPLNRKGHDLYCLEYLTDMIRPGQRKFRFAEHGIKWTHNNNIQAREQIKMVRKALVERVEWV